VIGLFCGIPKGSKGGSEGDLFTFWPNLHNVLLHDENEMWLLNACFDPSFFLKVNLERTAFFVLAEVSFTFQLKEKRILNLNLNEVLSYKRALLKVF